MHYGTILSLLLIIAIFASALPLQTTIATTAGETLIERGKDYELYQISDEQQKMVLGVETWVLDSDTGEYVPHTVDVVDKNTVEVNSGLIGWKISADSAIITNPETGEEITTETWQAFDGKTEMIMVFKSQQVVENSTGVYVINTYDMGSGSIDLTYAINDGQPTKRIITANGISKEDATALSFEREWTMDVEKVKVDETEKTPGKTETSEKQDGTKDTAEIVSDGEVVIKENLETSGDKLDTITYDDKTVTFKYDGFDSAEINLVDDTSTIADPNRDGYVHTNDATGTSCPTSTYTDVQTATGMDIRVEKSDVSGKCMRSYAEWDVTSIPDNAVVSDVDFSFDVNDVQSPRNCDFMPMMQVQPSFSGTDALLWTEIGNGTAYLSNDSTCTTTGDDKSVDLGNTALTDLQTMIAGNDWFAVGIMATSETRDTSARHAVNFLTEEHASATPEPTLTVVFTATVTQGITLTAASGSDTFETTGVTATITCTSGGGTHDGNAATQSFTCNRLDTVSIALPAATASYRYMWVDNTSTAKSFTSCSSGTCTTVAYTYYKQLPITITATGASASVQNVGVSRTQSGNAASENIYGATATAVWADKGSSMVISDVATVTADQERYKSYNSTAQRTVSVSAAASKAYIYQREFNTLFSVAETEVGTSTADAPAGSFTVTVTTANSTTIAATMDTISGDSITTASRSWIKSGTQTFGAITWRSSQAAASGQTCSITAYGTCEATVDTKHILASAGHRAFRLFVNGATSIASASYDANNRVLSFDATATGTQVIKIEYPLTLLSTISGITFGGSTVAAANYTSTNIDSATQLITINNQGFSTKTITVTFAASGSGGGGGGGGGSGGGGGGYSVPVIAAISPSSIIVELHIPEFNVAPGKSQTQNMVVIANGYGLSTITITDITFLEKPEWFTVGAELPKSYVLAMGDLHFVEEIPLTVTVPSGEQGIQKTIAAKVTIVSGTTTAQSNGAVTVNLGANFQPALYVGIGLVVAVAIGATVTGIKKRRR